MDGVWRRAGVVVLRSHPVEPVREGWQACSSRWVGSARGFAAPGGQAMIFGGAQWICGGGPAAVEGGYGLLKGKE